MHLYAPPPTAASESSQPARRPAAHPALAALALAAAAWLIGPMPAALAAPATVQASAPVATARLGSGNDRAVTTFTGHLQALQESTVAAQTAGNVLQIAVKAGDRVRAGQVLVRIDERSAQAGLTAADAGVAQADALWRQAQLQAERTRELRRQGFVSQAAQDAADTQLRAAQAGLDQARAGRVQAAVVRGFAGATAPFDGIVLATHVEAGDLAAPGRPLVTLYAPGQLRAVAQVPASRSALARAATQVDVQLPDGRWVTPARRTELPTADPVSQTVEWRLDLPADVAAGLSPGASVQVRFSGAPVAGAPSRPRVPASAVLQRGELSAVYAVRSERFVLQPVRLGAVHADGIELLAGLKPGEAYAVDAVRAGLAGAIPAAAPAPAAPSTAKP